ncbi:DUF2157 domain-containing protein [Rhizobiaceae bacterium BDR2-2]|uniref:DUF2157 domain-containing protein n=1 Tax=Ectorhizobium quercum TaxID=2965071 RepID=A0AAE3SUY9_9HYPH|nr:DUF2157 domain-containing protein [Ectorhizobium quercum]MCX8997582.1 DUF2157 domain-containing protein [Ectorhizobium quercum]
MYVKRVKRQLSEWADAGLLPPETAAVLARDLDSRASRIGIAQVLLVLAGIFLCVAFLLLVSANWELIPRIVRLGAVVALIWATHLAGALFIRAGRTTLGTAALLLGTACFGGGLSLAGQMYHISGDMVSMFTVWFLAAALTSVLFRSGAVAVAAGFVSMALCWSLIDVSGGTITSGNLWVPPALAVAMALLAWLSGQEKVAHFSFLLLIGWAVWLYGENDTVFVAAVFVALGFAIFTALALKGSPFARCGEALGGAPMIYALVLSAIGLFLLHISLQGGGLVGAAVVGLGLSVAALALAGSEHGGVRWLCYAMIGAIVFYLWMETVGSILGTSGFFLVAALVAGALAFAIVRLEKRLAGPRKRTSP